MRAPVAATLLLSIARVIESAGTAAAFWAESVDLHGAGTWREIKDAYSRADYELKLIQAAREAHASAADNQDRAAFGAESLDLHGAGGLEGKPGRLLASRL